MKKIFFCSIDESESLTQNLPLHFRRNGFTAFYFTLLFSEEILFKM